jgi:starch synthase
MVDQTDAATPRASARAGARAPATAARRKVLFVTSEMSDFVQTGGLGEVSAALPRALRDHCDVRVLLPGYPQALRHYPLVERVSGLPGLGDIPECAIGRVKTEDGLIVYVVLCPRLFEHPGTPYADEASADWADNDLRFARLSLAAADFASGLGDPSWVPDNLHLNDWPTSMAAAYVAWRGHATPTLLTIHNLAYQGCFDARRAKALGVPDHAFDMHGVELYGKLSFLKAGLYSASHLTTVSATYAREITTPELGRGLHGLLQDRAREGRLSGILNGIDDTWDMLPPGMEQRRFAPAEWKSRHARRIRRRFGLAVSRGPLFAIVSRLVHQKGVDLAIDAAQTIVEQGGQLIVTGQGEPKLEQGIKDLAARHPGAVGARIGFDAEEARAMFVASDFLLMPSRYEPCGLSQMYAQKSGSLPIAHKTGGLADTISDGETGFLFGQATSDGLNRAIRRAFTAFDSSRRIWSMRRAAMSQRYGWDRSAKRYVDAYRRGEAT